MRWRGGRLLVAPAGGARWLLRPGIQEHVFYEVCQRPFGARLDQVEKWIVNQSKTFAALGYYFIVRTISAPTRDIAEWVGGGDGYRAAILATDGTKLHKDNAMPLQHAVGLTLNDPTSGIEDKKLASGVLMVDAWPGVSKFSNPPDTLDFAHRHYKYRSLLMFWSGYG